MARKRAPEGTQAVVRAMRLLKAFSESRPVLTLAELSGELELSKTTAHRLLAALESEGLVARDAVGAFHLGPAVIALGTRALLSNDLRALVQPELKALAAETGETASLEVLADGRMLILDEVSGRHLVTAAAEIGTLWPLHATSTGKALLASLPEEECWRLLEPPLARYTEATITDPDELKRELETVRGRGYATAVEELEVGAAAAAAALRDRRGYPVGVISVGGPVGRLKRRRLAALGRTLRERAARLSAPLDHAI